MGKMKLTVGLGRLEDFGRLVEAGADEVFAGFVPLDWLERYGNTAPLNRRKVLLQDIQIDCWADMRILARLSQEAGVPVALTFNSPVYGAAQYPQIGDMLLRLRELGFADWIIADPGLLVHLQKRDICGRIHLSGEAGVFNPDAVRLFARLGVSRIIFPRKISPERMAACIAAAPQLEYEAFVLNEMCHYSGAFCASLHCDEMEPICRVPYRCYGPDCRSCPPERDPGAFGAGGCGLCALQRLEEAGVDCLKIVGRGGHIEWIERDVRLMRRALDMSDRSAEALMAAFFPDGCSGNCYYRD